MKLPKLNCSGPNCTAQLKLSQSNRFALNGTDPFKMIDFIAGIRRVDSMISTFDVSDIDSLWTINYGRGKFRKISKNWKSWHGEIRLIIRVFLFDF